MKRATTVIIPLILLFGLTACGQAVASSDSRTNQSIESAQTSSDMTGTAAESNTVDKVETDNNALDSQTAENEAPDETVKLRLSFDGGEAVVALYDNEASADFLNLLPLELTFEDYNATEKIAYLPRELAVEGQPDGFTPTAGDFAYYAPWGNLSVFYQEFRYSEQLIALGFFESGLEEMAGMDESFSVRIERLEN